MQIAKAMAAAKLMPTWAVKPECDSAKPPFKPKAMSRYKDRNREIAGGISKLDRTAPARTPTMKNKMAGSRRLCMVDSFVEILNFTHYFVKLILQHITIDKSL